jgi:hypothetical protein
LAQIVRDPVKNSLYQAVDVLVSQTAKNYAKATGNPLSGKALDFVKEIIKSMIDLIEESVKKGEVSPRAIGKLAFSRALAAVGLVADDRSWTECGAATVSLAISTIDVFGILVGAWGISSTGAGAIIGVPVIFASAAFYAYQVNEVVETCGETYVAKAEESFKGQFNVVSKRKMMTNYGDMVCKAPSDSVKLTKL